MIAQEEPHWSYHPTLCIVRLMERLPVAPAPGLSLDQLTAALYPAGVARGLLASRRCNVRVSLTTLAGEFRLEESGGGFRFAPGQSDAVDVAIYDARIDAITGCPEAHEPCLASAG